MLLLTFNLVLQMYEAVQLIPTHSCIQVFLTDSSYCLKKSIINYTQVWLPITYYVFFMKFITAVMIQIK